jgi:protein TonB
MEIKKSLKANLERSKSTFLLIGFILALSALICAFNYESLGEFVEVNTLEPIIEEDFAKITRPEDEKKQTFDKPTPKMVMPEIIILTEDSSLVSEHPEINWEPDPEIEIPEPVEEPDVILLVAEVKPKFPGGELALQRFVAQNVIYPALARENGIQGTVHIRFEVTKTGKVGRIEVLNKTQDALLQDAATNVIRKLPRFKPGMQNGKKVNVWYSIPISFKLK